MIQLQQTNMSLLDFLTIVSFVVGLANYDENVDQTTLQEIMQKAVTDIHTHLKMQDEKIDKIMGVLQIDS